MKRTYFLVGITIVLLTFNKLKSQDLTNYNLYTQNPVLYNPACGMDEVKLRAFLNTHIQWAGFDGAPRANTFGIYSNPSRKMGFGFTAYNNKQGFTSRTNLGLNYAYRAFFRENHYITFGLAAGIMMDRLQTDKIENSDLTDKTIIDNSFESNYFFARTGLSYYNNGFEVQFALPQLYNAGDYSGYTISSIGYDFRLDDFWSLKPILMFRSVKYSPSQFGLNMVATWQNRFWLMGGYQSNNSFLTGVGINFNDFQLGYAYQAERSYISAAAISTNEIQLVYRFGAGLPAMKEPRQKHSYYERTIANRTDTVYVIPVSDNTKIMGTILRKSDNRPVSGTLTVYENNAQIKQTQVNNGIINLDLKSGRTYKIELTSDNYPTITQIIEIPKSACVEQLTFLVDPMSKANVSIKDAETKLPLKGKIVILMNDKVVRTVNPGEDISNINLQPGIYVFDINADGYYKKKVTVDLTSQSYSDIFVQMEKIKKESFSLGMINFETNKAIIKPESFPILDNFIKVLNDNPELKFEIAGHTDNIGDSRENIILSRNRAKACVDYMISKGINKSRLTPVGYGETKPLVPNNTVENRAKNRRVEAKIIE